VVGKDDKVDWLFSHLDRVASAHVAGLLFGPGTPESTSVQTDGGNLFAKTITYQNSGGTPLKLLEKAAAFAVGASFSTVGLVLLAPTAPAKPVSLRLLSAGRRRRRVDVSDFLLRRPLSTS
jgi:hypothetical protein